eukprot:9791146-Alexandrium_andersonii.AAC.1
MHSLTRPLTHSLTQPPTQPLTPLTQPLTHSATHPRSHLPLVPPTTLSKSRSLICPLAVKSRCLRAH